MGKSKKHTLTDVLREGVRDSGLSLYRIAKDTGLVHASLLRFMDGTQSLRLDMADTLAAYLGVFAFRSAGKSRRKAVLVANRDIRRIPVLRYLLRLMMATDATKSAFRWWTRMSPDRSDVTKTDQLICLVTMMGWAWEVILLLREGEKKGYISRNTLKQKDRPMWDLIFSNPPPDAIRKLCRARNKYFAHWDENIAKACIERLSQEAEPVAFVEFTNTGSFGTTRFPWVYEAIAGDIVDPNAGIEEWKKVFREASDVTTGLAKLVPSVVVTVLDAHGLRIEESTAADGKAGS